MCLSFLQFRGRGGLAASGAERPCPRNRTRRLTSASGRARGPTEPAARAPRRSSSRKLEKLASTDRGSHVTNRRAGPARCLHASRRVAPPNSQTVPSGGPAGGASPAVGKTRRPPTFVALAVVPSGSPAVGGTLVLLCPSNTKERGEGAQLFTVASAVCLGATERRRMTMPHGREDVEGKSMACPGAFRDSEFALRFGRDGGSGVCTVRLRAPRGQVNIVSMLLTVCVACTCLIVVAGRSLSHRLGKATLHADGST